VASSLGTQRPLACCPASASSTLYGLTETSFDDRGAHPRRPIGAALDASDDAVARRPRIGRTTGTPASRCRSAAKTATGPSTRVRPVRLFVRRRTGCRGRYNTNIGSVLDADGMVSRPKDVAMLDEGGYPVHRWAVPMTRSSAAGEKHRPPPENRGCARRASLRTANCVVVGPRGSRMGPDHRRRGGTRRWALHQIPTSCANNVRGATCADHAHPRIGWSFRDEPGRPTRPARCFAANLSTN